MKNLFRYVLVTAVAVFVFGAGSQINAQDQSYVRELYKKMEANQKSLTSLRTSIRMERYNAQLRVIEDKREGKALYLPAKDRKNVNIRLDWTNPVQETLSVLNGEYQLYRPRLGQVMKGKTKDVQNQAGAGNVFSLINMSSKDLKSNFDAQWLGAELIAGGAISAYKLKLTPKTDSRHSNYEVWVNEAGMVVQAKLYEKNGDTTTFLLFGTERNAKISMKQLALNLPKTVQVIEG
jgi:outer membrane lipoprotein-sorting protein